LLPPQRFAVARWRKPNMVDTAIRITIITGLSRQSPVRLANVRKTQTVSQAVWSALLPVV